MDGAGTPPEPSAGSRHDNELAALREFAVGTALVCRSQRTREVLLAAHQVLRERVQLAGPKSGGHLAGGQRWSQPGRGGYFPRKAGQLVATTGEADLRTELGLLLRAVGAEPPIEARDLCRLVGVHLGKPIDVAGRPIPTASGAGAAMAVGEGYLILYQAATDQVHQTHIIFHELMHILRGHLQTGASADLTCRFVAVGDSSELPDPAAQTMEWEAETGAAILSEWNDGDQALWARAGRDRSAFRFGTALQGPLRWT